MRVGSSLFESINVLSGVRQGCPLSPLLFAICADVLLRTLGETLQQDEALSAFADDTAMVVASYVKAFPSLCCLFDELASISALELNVKKIVFIPLWACRDLAKLRLLITEVCPRWRHIGIERVAKYLGFMIGPGSEEKSWSKPLRKYSQWYLTWGALRLGALLNIVVYRSFIASVLSYVWQLEPLPDHLMDNFQKALVQLAPGPGSWVSRGDLCNLTSFGFPCEFSDPRWTALAAKLRVVYTVATDCQQRRKEIEVLPLEMGRRPFPSWHRKCYFSVLAEAVDHCRLRGVTTQQIAKESASNQDALGFQSLAEQMISSKFADPYFQESRIRAKSVFWKFNILPGHLERRVVGRFRLLDARASPKVWFVYFRTLWNGWVTHDRMKQILSPRPCVLGCGFDEDRVDHYCCCNVYWDFLRRPRPQGMGIQSPRAKDTAMLLSKHLSSDDVLRLAFGLYGLYRTVNTARFSDFPNMPTDFLRLLRMYTKQAMMQSRASQLLLP